MTFTGDAWNNNDGSARTLTINGAGRTLISGNITASGTTKNLVKDSAGLLTLDGTGGTLTGTVTTQGNGGLAIRDFRAINNGNSAVVNLGASTNQGGSLIIGTSSAPGGAANLTTTKVLNLGGTAASTTAGLYANQTGANRWCSIVPRSQSPRQLQISPRH